MTRIKHIAVDLALMAVCIGGFVGLAHLVQLAGLR